MDAFFLKSYSTGKSSHRHAQPVRLIEYPASTRLVQSDKKRVPDKDRPQPVRIKELFVQAENSKSVQKKSETERHQPVRIAQFFGQAENSKSVQKESGPERERRQPVRVAQLLGQSEKPRSVQRQSASAKRRVQPERLPTNFHDTKNISLSGKREGRSISAQTATAQRCVRRILNFNDFTSGNQKSAEKTRSKPKKSILPEKIVRENSEQKSGRKSLLLPPNTIKQIHVRRCSRILEVSENEDNKKSGTEVRPGTRSTEPKSKTTCPPEIHVTEAPESTDNIVNPSGLGNTKMINREQAVEDVYEHSHRSMGQIIDEHDEDNAMKQTVLQCQNTFEHITSYLTEDTKCDDKRLDSLCNDLESTKIAEKVQSVDAMCTSETVCVKREDMTFLENNLKHLIQTAEENISKLKSALSHLTKLSTNSSCMSCAKRNINRLEEKQISATNLPPIETDKLLEVPETVAEVPNEVEESKEEEVHPQISDESTQVVVLAESTTLSADSRESTATRTENLNEHKPEQVDENDKENCLTESAPENGKMTPRVAQNDSFLQLENELNITHAQRLSGDQTVWQNTPIARKLRNRRGERSLREYMVLKSTMSFLETPDAKRFRSLGLQDNASHQSFLSKTHISSKILTDLRNLYAESPDS